MIPQTVYNHMKYSKCNPGASLIVKDGYKYILSRVYSFGRDWMSEPERIVCMLYPPIPDDYYQNKDSRERWHNRIVRNVPLSSIPDSRESDWNIYITGEC